MFTDVVVYNDDTIVVGDDTTFIGGCVSVNSVAASIGDDIPKHGDMDAAVASEWVSELRTSHELHNINPGMRFPVKHTMTKRTCRLIYNLVIFHVRGHNSRIPKE